MILYVINSHKLMKSYEGELEKEDKGYLNAFGEIKYHSCFVYFQEGYSGIYI